MKALFFCLVTTIFIPIFAAGTFARETPEEKRGESAESPKTIFSALTEAGFVLQRSDTGKEEKEPAQIAFLKTFGDETVYSASFFLGWTPPNSSCPIGPFRIEPQISIEGDLTSDESEAEDAWKFRLSTEWDSGEILGVDAIYAKVSAKYEADQDFDTQKILAETYLTPTCVPLAMGKGWPLNDLDEEGHAKDNPPLQFLWRPYIGFDSGHTMKPGISAETEDTILRILLRLKITFLLNFLKSWLGLHEVTVYADNAFYLLPLEKTDDAHNYLASGVVFNFTENLSFDLTYKLGEDSPDFRRIETLGGAFGVKF